MRTGEAKKTREERKKGSKERGSAIPETRSSSIYNEISGNIFIAVTARTAAILRIIQIL